MKWKGGPTEDALLAVGELVLITVMFTAWVYFVVLAAAIVGR